MVEDVRNHERKILELCVKKGNMPRPHFIKVFPGNETNLEWIKHEIQSNKPYGALLMRNAPNVIDEKDRFYSRLATIPGISPMPSIGDKCPISTK